MSKERDVLTLPHDELEALQLEGIKKTLVKCYENVPFYKGGHMLFWVEAEKFNAAVAEFFDSVK